MIAYFAAYPEWTGAVKQADVVATGTGDRAEQVRFVLDAGAMRVPTPAAGLITITFIAGCKYKGVGAECSNLLAKRGTF